MLEAQSNVGGPEYGAHATYPEVDRRSNLSLREFRNEYLLPGLPVVITDATTGWQAAWKWTFEFFRERYGDFPVKVWRYDQDSEFTAEDTRTIPLADFVDAVESGSWESYPYYMRDNWRLIHENPELRDDYREPPYFHDWFKLLPAFMRMPYPRVFLGPTGATTPLHVDVWRTHAWLSQLVGRKRWLLYPPEQQPYLADCKVKVDHPDLQAFPEFKDASALECTIGPGDTVFVPSGWAHWVLSLDASISLTSNYMGPGCFASCLVNSSKEFATSFARRFTPKLRVLDQRSRRF